ncbi:MAG: Smr/MutS family protein [Bdellovibrionales bacterium]|nr:Smr/MutS family protein [Bdellovibrionales bacterium]
MAKDSIDLHGYRVDEVADEVDRFLMRLSSSNLKRAKIITGKGSGAVQKATIEYLKRAGYHFAFEKLSNGKENSGVLILFLD